MRRVLAFLVLFTAVLGAAPATGDPLRVTSGNFTIDIEGDMFSLMGSGFALQTTELLITSPKIFAPHCSQCSPGELVDWSFHTDGEQLLGSGQASIGLVNATNVAFVGALSFQAVPTPFPAAGGDQNVVFSAPFAFTGLIRGFQGGQQLFVQQFVGRGVVSVDYEPGAAPGLFTEDDDTIPYEFSATPVPEPGSVLLLSSALALVIARGRRARAGQGG
jgi:hypothetical protein